MNQSFFDRRSFTIIAVMVFLMPFLLRGTRLALQTNRNDIKDWLPSDFPETKTHSWFQKHFPLEQFVLASWEGCTLQDQRLEMLAKKLENFDPDLKRLGIEPEVAQHLKAAGLGTRGAIRQYIQNRGNLRSIPGISRSDAEEVAAAVDSWHTPFKTPVLTGARLVEQLQAHHPELTRQEVLRRLEASLIGKDHRNTCLLVTLNDYAKGRNLRQTLEDIRELARQCNIEPPKKEPNGSFLVRLVDGTVSSFRDMVFGRDGTHAGIYLGGPPVDNVAIDVEGERTLYRLAGLCAVVGLGISWFCFRSFRLTFLVFFVALLAAGVGLASVFFSRNTVDAILLSMPSLVYVLAISGGVHIINYYHDAIREHGLDRAPERALAHGMLPCTLAAVTTALGLGSLLASHLIPISKFGVFSAWGVLATLGLLFLFLPACLHFFPSKEYVRGGTKNPDHRQREPALTRFWQAVGALIIRRNGWVTAGCLIAMAVFMVGLTRIDVSVKLMRLFSPDAEIVHDYGWLEKHVGPLVPMEVVLRVDNEKCRLNLVQQIRMARDVEETIERIGGDVGGALSAATFMPPAGPTSRNARIRLGWSPTDSTTSGMWAKHRHDDTIRDFLQSDRDATLEELGIPDKLAQRLRAKRLTSMEAIVRHNDLASIEGIGPDGARQLSDAVEKWQAAHGVNLWRVTGRVRALTDLDYSRFVETLRARVEKVLDNNYRKLTERDLAAGARPQEGIEAIYTGLVPLVYKTQHVLLAGLFDSLKWAFALIALVMMVVLRSPSAGLLSMVPNVFPVVLIFGAMGWLGILVDVGTMMTASVALGVAVDDTIHFLTWFRRGLDEGQDRKGAVMLAYERCGTAMTQTTLIGGLGLSVFAFSTFTPTQRFGVLMLTLLTAALMGDLVFLPALLSGPFGRVFRAHKKKAKPAKGEPPGGLAGRDRADQEVVVVPLMHQPRSDSTPRPTRAS